MSDMSDFGSLAHNAYKTGKSFTSFYVRLSYFGTVDALKHEYPTFLFRNSDEEKTK